MRIVRTKKDRKGKITVIARCDKETRKGLTYGEVFYFQLNDDMRTFGHDDPTTLRYADIDAGERKRIIDTMCTEMEFCYIKLLDNRANRSRCTEIAMTVNKNSWYTDNNKLTCELISKVEKIARNVLIEMMEVNKTKFLSKHYFRLLERTSTVTPRYVKTTLNKSNSFPKYNSGTNNLEGSLLQFAKLIAVIYPSPIKIKKIITTS